MSLLLNNGSSIASARIGSTVSLPISVEDGAKLTMDYPQDIISVTHSGGELTVTGLKTGTARLLVTASKDGLADNTQLVNVTVSSLQAVSLSMSRSSLAGVIGQTQTVQLSADPADAAISVHGGNGIVQYTYGSGALKITPVTAGSTTLTVTASREGIAAATACLYITVAPKRAL